MVPMDPKVENPGKNTERCNANGKTALANAGCLLDLEKIAKSSGLEQFPIKSQKPKTKVINVNSHHAQMQTSVKHASHKGFWFYFRLDEKVKLKIILTKHSKGNLKLITFNTQLKNGSVQFSSYKCRRLLPMSEMIGEHLRECSSRVNDWV